MKQGKPQPNQALDSKDGYKPGAGERIRKAIEEDLKQFDLAKKPRAAKSIEDMKRIYITH